jgi:hypothetical protein
MGHKVRHKGGKRDILGSLGGMMYSFLDDFFCPTAIPGGYLSEIDSHV